MRRNKGIRCCCFVVAFMVLVTTALYRTQAMGQNKEKYIDGEVMQEKEIMELEEIENRTMKGVVLEETKSKETVEVLTKETKDMETENVIDKEKETIESDIEDNETIEKESIDDPEEIVLPEILEITYLGDRMAGYEWYTSTIEGNILVKVGTYELERVTIQINGYSGLDENGDFINLGTIYEDISSDTGNFSFSIIPQSIEDNPDCSYTVVVSVLDTEGNEVKSQEQILYIETGHPSLEIQAYTSFDPSNNNLDEEYLDLKEESPWTACDIKINPINTNFEVQSEIQYKVKTESNNWSIIEEPSSFLITCKEGETVTKWYEFQAISLKTGLSSNSLFRYIKIDKKIPEMPELMLNPQTSSGENGWYDIFPSFIVKRPKNSGSDIKTKVDIIYQDHSTRSFYLNGDGEDELTLERDGICSVTAVSENEVGYKSKNSTIEQIKVDTTKPLTPEVYIDSKIVKKWFITNHIIKVHFASEDANSGISHYQYKLVPQGKRIEEIPFLTGESLYISPQFKGELYVYVVDKAGNSSYQGGTIEEGKVIALTVEDQPPTINIQSDVDFKNWQKQDVNLKINVKDSLSGIQQIFYTYGGMAYEVEIDESSPYDIFFSIVCKDDSVRDDGAQIDVKAVDYAGNISEESIKVKIDKTLPMISVSGVAEGGCYNKDVTLNLQVEDNNLKEEELTAVVQRTLNEKIITSNGSIHKEKDGYKLILDEEGTYQISISAKDKAGNERILNCPEFMIDKTVPKISVTGGDDHQVSSRPLVLSFEIEDLQDESPSIEYEIKRLDINQITTVLPIKELQHLGKKTTVKEELKEDGIYTLKITAKDKCGNESFLSRQITIDTEDPIIRYIDELEGSYLQSFLFKYKMQDVIEELTFLNYEITLDGLPFDVKKEVVDEGPHIIKVTVYDEVGHQGIATARFVIDHTEPVILFLDITEEGILENEICNIILLDDYDWFEEILINGKKYLLNEKTSKVAIELTEDGEYEIFVKAKDLAGNVIEEKQQFKYINKDRKEGQQKISLKDSQKDQNNLKHQGLDNKEGMKNDLNTHKSNDPLLLPILIILFIIGGAVGISYKLINSNKKIK